MIQFYNTLKGEIEKFSPLHEREVRMYACGPTVYDFAHIGNFRAFVFEDLLRRFLHARGFNVKHVMNLTDVDDKTIAGAARDGKKLEEFTEVYTRAFQEDLKTLNILPPNYPAEQPRATREIPAMIELIERLVKKGNAYVSEGSVYYRVASFSGYGKLSKKKLEQNITGARVDVDQYEKEEGSDFALWKKAREGEPAWDSPWGKGRPGWHIECSAMSIKYLGEQFDIHAGGEDLIFPHHENEIAQSEGATDKVPFVKYWLHCKFLLVNGEKMSKSKGNFFTLRDLLAKGYDPMSIRFALLAVHYRQPLNFTLEGIAQSLEFITRLRECYFEYLSRLKLDKFSKGPAGPQVDLECLDGHCAKMVESLAEDLNIAKCVAELSAAVRKMNTDLKPGLVTRGNVDCALHFFESIDRLLGLQIVSHQDIPADILDLLKRYIDLRKEKKYKDSDGIRQQIDDKGWRVKDYAIQPGMHSTSGYADKVGSTIIPKSFKP